MFSPSLTYFVQTSLGKPCRILPRKLFALCIHKHAHSRPQINRQTVGFIPGSFRYQASGAMDRIHAQCGFNPFVLSLEPRRNYECLPSAMLEWRTLVCNHAMVRFFKNMKIKKVVISIYKYGLKSIFTFDKLTVCSLFQNYSHLNYHQKEF